MDNVVNLWPLFSVASLMSGSLLCCHPKPGVMVADFVLGAHLPQSITTQVPIGVLLL